ncbi:hypothetical protein T4B_9473 [Trichinella pseudospiralis]|uniref:Uncharacterized protein n=2 Tax=Trichinella pseudospiralis TaxID=6337 RepID=A0A0V1FJ27_TRIPS|nr:hypothetical protein T4D_6887 [Trichinella pseudospiralis]KRZ30378.1 hypothetical protein T4B_9473 [Trichinella pseudospiralis]
MHLNISRTRPCLGRTHYSVSCHQPAVAKLAVLVRRGMLASSWYPTDLVKRPAEYNAIAAGCPAARNTPVHFCTSRLH